MNSQPKGPVITKEKPELPKILKEDPLEKMITPREGEGELFKKFKKEVMDNIRTNAGCIALAKRMCDDPNFYKIVEQALLEREKRGYKWAPPDKITYSFLDSEMFKLRSALAEISEKESFEYDSLPSFILHGKVTYANLKKSAENDLSVIKEIEALNTLLEKHQEEFTRRLTFLTLHDYVSDHKAAKFTVSLLRTIWEKNLYKDEFKFADIGTGSGEFSDEFISFIMDRFRKYTIVRTNPIELKIARQKDLPVRIHDISKEDLGEKFNLVIIKDVMKFFERGEPRGVIWENVKHSTIEGGIVISGGQGEFRPHVLYNGDLVRLHPEAFLRELEKVRNYKDYLKNLGEIVKRSNYDRVLGMF
jgi:hypothetical protein